MKEERITFPSGGLTLEGLMVIPAGSPAVRGGVVCHPHPQYGGSMYNNVVEAALEAMWRLGWATLRFNFRGVGESEGEHGGGVGEAADAAAAAQFLIGQAGVAASGAVLAGYSFGAMAALTAAPTIANLAALALIALPLRMTDTAALERFNQPIVLAAGDRDGYCPVAELQALHRRLGARSQLEIIAGADHFFGGFEENLASVLEAMLQRVTTTS
ncbi:MAG: alpha/beta hydrolase [Candidatus Binataceae bacterium]